MPQGFEKLQRQRGRYELREDLFVAQIGVDDVLKTVIMDKLIEEIRGEDHRSRHKDADVLPSVKEVMFLQNMIEERQPTSLASHRAVAATGEIDRTVIGLRRIARYDAERLIDAVVVDQTDIDLADVLDIRIAMDTEFLDLATDSKQAAGKKPFGEVVIITQTAESSR